MQKALMVVGGVVWFALVFTGTWWMTFPSDEVGERVKVEVSNATNGDFELALSDVRPWWTGASATNVILYEVKPVRGQDAVEKNPMFAFEAARVRASLFSLLRNEPRVVGAVQIGGSELDFDVTTGMNKKGTQLAPRLVALSADEFPVQDLAGLAGATLEASGGIDLEVDLEAEESMRDAIGDIKIGGRDILITSIDPELTGGMDLGMEVPIDEIDIHFEIEDGKATVRKGSLESPLLDTEIEGDITLREDISRSSMSLSFAIELGEELQMFKGFMKRAEWSDGSFHYKCTGNFSRPICREDPERGKRRAGRDSASGSGADDVERPRRNRMSSEEREKRRKEALERLRNNRERRSQEADEERDEGEELEEIGYEEGDEEFDEELPEDELPVEGELEEPVYDD